MKGYAIFTTERQIIVKDKEEIDNYYPHFWTDNSDYMVRKWEFDTDIPDTVKHIVIYLKDLDRAVVPLEVVNGFLSQIGVDLNDLKRKP